MIAALKEVMGWNLVALSDDVRPVKHHFAGQEKDRHVVGPSKGRRCWLFPCGNEIGYGFTIVIGSPKMPSERLSSSLLNPCAFTPTAESKTGGVKANSQLQIAS